MADIIITYKCNQSYPYCFAKGKPGKSKEDLSLKNFNVILKFFKNSKEKEVRLLGGEPTCHPEFKQIVEKAIEDKFSPHIFTNGLFNPEMLGFLKKQEKKIKYSFNINNPKNYTEKQWSNINQNLKILSVINPIALTFNIFDLDFEYDYILDLASKYKLIAITLCFTNPIINQKNKFLPLSDFEKTSLKIKKIIRDFPASVKQFTLSFGCGLPDNIVQKFSNIPIKSFIKSIKVQSGCQGNTGKFDIGPNLEVFRCLPLIGWRQKKLSDFKTADEVTSYFDSVMKKEQEENGKDFLNSGPCFSYFLSEKESKRKLLLNEKTLILAIDTTSASSACAVVKNGKEVIFNSINATFLPKIPWGELLRILPRYHLDFVLETIERDFKKNNISWDDIGAIAVSSKSGVFTSMLVGISVAKTLSQIYKKPLIEVDHILAHIYAPWIERNPEDFSYPILVFSSSGSHSNLALIRELNELEILSGEVPRKIVGNIEKYVGVGMLFCQIGNILGVIKQSDENQAEAIKRLCSIMDSGNPQAYDFKNFYQGPIFDFDFLQFMEAVKIFVEEKRKKQETLNEKDVADISAGFQEAITEIISEKILTVAQSKKAKEVHITGGISKNAYLKKKLSDKIARENYGYVLRYPAKDEYCIDNAAMIGALAYYQEKYDIQFQNFKSLITY